MAHATSPDRLAVPAFLAKAQPLDIFSRFARRVAAGWNTSDEAEIRRALARSGGRITDSMERELMRSVLDPSWRGRF